MVYYFFFASGDAYTRNRRINKIRRNGESTFIFYTKKKKYRTQITKNKTQNRLDLIYRTSLKTSSPVCKSIFYEKES